MILHKGETLFHQGQTGPLYHLKSGLLKIVRLHRDGTPVLMNVIVPNEMIPHHSLISPNAYFGTAIALVTCEIDVLPAAQWYRELADTPDKCREIALLLQEKLRMMQQRIDQLTETSPAERLRRLQVWLQSHVPAETVTSVFTQDEIGQFIGLRRETVNRLLRAQRTAGSCSSTPAGPKNS
ncbi:Crp/Fnr family transcriptional regulator [Paenibacillus thalictri]|uniref:Crp/Fnr family transcriptional regulator n=1 Tax=Paenibacillus thalictri TaxID=2527873 RepID=A0A4Q9DKL9_9BACL|nr:Crp/Fnr family transcriptional regulator [Paenibacillus thalictri]TBL74586.1 Crp/Fnr family transcriptional regulator [Paenibacillus thalictri]